VLESRIFTGDFYPQVTRLIPDKLGEISSGGNIPMLGHWYASVYVCRQMTVLPVVESLRLPIVAAKFGIVVAHDKSVAWEPWFGTRARA
jgi:hypothetical protein